jgi:hypothetical protein
MSLSRLEVLEETGLAVAIAFVRCKEKGRCFEFSLAYFFLPVIPKLASSRCHLFLLSSCFRNTIKCKNWVETF